MSPSENPFKNAVVLTVAGGFGPQDNVGRYDQPTFYLPIHAVEDRNGNILVSDSGNHKIKRVTPSYVVELVAGGTADYVNGDLETARFEVPTFMALAEDGSLYISDRRSQVIRRLVDNERVETAAGSPDMPYLEIGKDYVYTLDHRGRIDYTLEEWERANKDFSFEYLDGDKRVARFASPAGLAFTSAGELLIADERNHMIRVLDRDGQVKTLAGHRPDSWFDLSSVDAKGGDASLQYPVALCSDGTGGFLVTEKTPAIRALSAAGQLTTIFRDANDPNNSRIYDPVGIVRDRTGNIFIACGKSHKLACLTTHGTWSFLGASEPGHVDGLAETVRFSEPSGLSLDRNGDLLVIDTRNHAIRRVCLNPSTAMRERMPMPQNGMKHILFEAESPNFIGRAPLAPTAVTSWLEIVGKRISFVENSGALKVLHFDEQFASLRGVGGDPVLYFGDDYNIDRFHSFSEHVHGQTVLGLRLHYTWRSLQDGLVEFIGLQFADGGFQYVRPVHGYGLALVSGMTLLPEAKAIEQSIRAIEQGSNNEITLVLDEGKLTISSRDGAPIETLYSQADESTVFSSLEPVPNPLALANGLDINDDKPVFSISVPIVGPTSSPKECHDAGQRILAPTVWQPGDANSAVGKQIVALNLPQTLENAPVGQYVILSVFNEEESDRSLFDETVIQFRTLSSGIEVQYTASAIS